jgi:hypothetical protein
MVCGELMYSTLALILGFMWVPAGSIQMVFLLHSANWSHWN